MQKLNSLSAFLKYFVMIRTLVCSIGSFSCLDYVRSLRWRGKRRISLLLLKTRPQKWAQVHVLRSCLFFVVNKSEPTMLARSPGHFV